jgi:predicted Rossmann fold nucleotide-binding protein DprA/Smf involved in DNA uptake
LLPATADEIARATGRTPANVAATLAELELGGLVAEGDGIYRALA